MSDSQPKAERPKPDPKALTPEYHKARKQLMLWASILLIWELVGIDLEKAQESGGNAGALIKSIKSPQAVPWALLLLVAYFAFKSWIEWRQCSERRRTVREAKMDYYSACVVALAACALYLLQTLSHVQFANVLDKLNVLSFIAGCFSFGGLVGLAFGLWDDEGKLDVNWLVPRCIFVAAALVALFVMVFFGRGSPRFQVHWPSAGAGAVVGVITIISLNLGKIRTTKIVPEE